MAALDVINLTTNDLAFDKDVAQPSNTLAGVRGLIHRPCEVPRLADRLLGAASSTVAGAWWRLGTELLEAAPPTETPSAAVALPEFPAGLDPLLGRALRDFLSAISVAAAFEDRAFAALDADARAYLAAGQLVPLAGADVDAKAIPRLLETGVGSEAVRQVEAESGALDPEPAALRLLALAGRVNTGALLAAAGIQQAAAATLAAAVAPVTRWPAEVVRLNTPWGPVVVGTSGPDRHTQAALLILEPGGDDTYGGAAGVANGLTGAPLSLVVDLAGEDRYASERLLGAATALFGVAGVLDLAGDDTYRAAHLGQGSGVLGAAWLEDRQGQDRYEARTHAQGAGTCGMGFVHDWAGHDTWWVGTCGQAFAGLRGVGVLQDDSGNDVYQAGGREPDYERHTEHFLSMAQGFATGIRPFAGGGVAALVDGGGNDTYLADVYGQGVSYWYAAGFLLDLGGHDNYRIHEYGQGAGIHLSAALLYDRSGNDHYTGYSLAQGAGHDYGVGWLLDGGGDDDYTADHYSQGRGINNALGVLVDVAGRDGYFARQPDSCQGIGQVSAKREYDSLSLLLDLGGFDVYSCGATNGAALPRPDVGVVYDHAAGGQP